MYYHASRFGVCGGEGGGGGITTPGFLVKKGNSEDLVRKTQFKEAKLPNCIVSRCCAVLCSFVGMVFAFPFLLMVLVR